MKLLWGLLKWLLLAAFLGSGWIALFIFFIGNALSEGGNRLGLPVTEIDPKDFWNYGYEGEIPATLLEKSNLLIYSRYGFTDIVQLGLVSLDEEGKDALLQTLFKDTNIETKTGFWAELTLCSGSGQLALEWLIQEDKLVDYFGFCSTVARKNEAQVRKIKLEKRSDNNEYTYMDITYFVGTNYFVVNHGGT